MTRAILDINGKQYDVTEGRYLQVDRFAGEVEQTFTLDNVRLIVNGEASLIGAPYVDGANAQVRIKRHFRGPKLLVYKMRCKKGYRRKNGHRQEFTELFIDVLNYPGRKDAPKPPQKASVVETVEPESAEKPVKKPATAKKASVPKTPAEDKPAAKKPAAKETTTKKAADVAGDAPAVDAE